MLENTVKNGEKKWRRGVETKGCKKVEKRWKQKVDKR